MARRAYQKRRGWLAWHIAALGRIDHRRFPDLADLTGEKGEHRLSQSAQQMVHNVRLLKAALKARRQ